MNDLVSGLLLLTILCYCVTQFVAIRNQMDRIENSINEHNKTMKEKTQ